MTTRKPPYLKAYILWVLGCMMLGFAKFGIHRLTKQLDPDHHRALMTTLPAAEAVVFIIVGYFIFKIIVAATLISPQSANDAPPP